MEGNCVDMPSEPEGERLKKNIKTTAYPAEIRGGVVWVYMGPKEKQPVLPDLEWAYLPERQRTATKRMQMCNWAQAVEGGIDSSHISFLHGATEAQHKRAADQGVVGRNRFNATDRHPVFDVKEVPYGLAIAARRNAEADNYYWRITQFLLPFHQMIPPVVPERDSSNAPYSGHAWVPIDDETTWTWTFSAHPKRDFTDQEREFNGGPEGMWGPIDENFMPKHNAANDYLLDRKLQRELTFTGIKGIPNQDAAVQESMGRIVPRWKEHVGTSDTAIVRWRSLMLRLARELQGGKDPDAAKHGEWYNVRSCANMLKRDEDWQEGCRWLTTGGQIPAAAAE